MNNAIPVSVQAVPIDGSISASPAPALSRGGPIVLGTDPDWDEARRLLREGRSTARALAEEIERLRAAFLRDKFANLKKGNSPISQVVKSGFVAKLREELNLHPQQAERLQEAASYELRIEALALAKPGDAITWQDDTGRTCQLRATRDLIEAACDAMQHLRMPGGLRPSRAWAGLFGASLTSGKDRAPVDHYRNLVRSMKGLANSLEEWNRIKGTERATLEAAWIEMLEANIVPNTFIEAVLARFGPGRR